MEELSHREKVRRAQQAIRMRFQDKPIEWDPNQPKTEDEWELVFESSDIRTYRKRVRQSVDDRISPPCEDVEGAKERIRQRMTRRLQTAADINKANAEFWKRHE